MVGKGACEANVLHSHRAAEWKHVSVRASAVRGAGAREAPRTATGRSLFSGCSLASSPVSLLLTLNGSRCTEKEKAAPLRLTSGQVAQHHLALQPLQEQKNPFHTSCKKKTNTPDACFVLIQGHYISASLWGFICCFQVCVVTCEHLYCFTLIKQSWGIHQDIAGFWLPVALLSFPCHVTCCRSIVQ